MYAPSSYRRTALPPDPSAVYGNHYTTSAQDYGHPAPHVDDDFDDACESVQYRHRDPREQLLRDSQPFSSSISSRYAPAPYASSRAGSRADGGYALAPVQQRGDAGGLGPEEWGAQAGRRWQPAPRTPVALSSAFSSAFAAGGLSSAASVSRFSAFAAHSPEELLDEDGDGDDAVAKPERPTPAPRTESPPTTPRDTQRPPPVRSANIPRAPAQSVPAPADDWMEFDSDTVHLLQRSSKANARSHQAMDEEAFLWGDAAPLQAEPSSSSSSRLSSRRSRVELLSNTAELTDRQREERMYLHRLTSQESRRKKVALGEARETDLGRLSALKKRAAASLKVDPPPPGATLSFTASLELELRRDRPALAAIDIEEADSLPVPPSQSSAASLGGQGKRSWKDELDKAIDSAPPAALSAVRPAGALHSRKGRRRGGLEDRLEGLIRARQSSITLAQHRRQQQQPLQSALATTADADGRYPAILVRMVASAEQYSLLFTVCVLCSPYNPPLSPLHLPAPDALALPSSLPSLVAFAQKYGVPLSQVVVVIFSAQQRRDLRLPADSSSAGYFVLSWPWFDVGQRMGVYGRVLVDVFDCAAFDRQQGEEREHRDVTRRALEGEAEHLDRANEDSHSINPSDADMKEAEAEQQQHDALRAVFGDLSADEIASLVQGAEDDDRRELLQRAEEEVVELPAKAPSALPLAMAFADYRRVQLASLEPLTSLHHTALVGVVRKVQLHGHVERCAPDQPRFLRSRLPCVWIDDGSALVQVEVARSSVPQWSEVLLQGTGKVIWIGGGRMNEDVALGTGNADGLSSMLDRFGYPHQRGMRVVHVGERSRWRMRPLHEQTLLPADELHQAQRITQLREIVSGQTAGARVHVHARLLHVQWASDRECQVWLSDASLMPGSQPLLSSCVLVTFRHFLHLQLLRSFFHPADPLGSSVVIQDLLVACPPESILGPCVSVEADAFTELLLPKEDLRCDVTGFETTQHYHHARAALLMIDAVDPLCPSVTLSLAQQLVSPFAILPSILPLSSLLTAHAMLGQTASPALQRSGLFLVDGVVMGVSGRALVLRQCPACGFEMAFVAAERRSPLSAFCERCKQMAPEAHPLVGRVLVDVKCSDVVHALKVELSPAVVSACMSGISAAARQAALADERELRSHLLSKRVRCLCACVAPKDSAVPARELSLRAMDEARDLRRRS